MNSIQEILTRLVGIRSFFPYEGEAFEFISEFLVGHGFTCYRQEVEADRYNLLAEKGDFDTSVVVYMHIDTVEAGSHWKRDPFVLCAVRGRYRGLGVFDMKGGIAALMSVLPRVDLQQHNLKLVFAVDEEGISRGVNMLVKSDFLDDVVMGFCPEACIVPEEWNLPVMITIGGRGRCVVRVDVPGLVSHGADERSGVNAIDQAAVFVSSLRKLKRKSDKNFGKSSFFVRSIHGGNDSLSIPGVVYLEIDYQLTYGQTPHSVCDDIRDFARGLYAKGVLSSSLEERMRVELVERGTPYSEPYIVNRTNRYVKMIEKLAISRYGRVQFDYAKSVADQNVIVNAGVPVITVGPIGGGAHEASEWVSKRSLDEVAEIYTQILNMF